MTLCPRIKISPTFSRPGGSGRSEASPTRIVTPHSGLPMDSTRRSPGRLNEHELAVSDMP
jgi:hypothetical protein